MEAEVVLVKMVYIMNWSIDSGKWEHVPWGPTCTKSTGIYSPGVCQDKGWFLKLSLTKAVGSIISHVAQGTI